MAATTDQLHTFAVNAEANLEHLATGIATVGADDNTINGIKQMADACRQIALHLAQGGNAQPAAEQPDAAAEGTEPADAAPEAPGEHASPLHAAIAHHMAQRRIAGH